MNMVKDYVRKTKLDTMFQKNIQYGSDPWTPEGFTKSGVSENIVETTPR